MFRRKTQPINVPTPPTEFHEGENQFKKVITAVKQLDELLKEYKDVEFIFSERIKDIKLENTISPNVSNGLMTIPFTTISDLLRFTKSVRKDMKFFEDHFMGRPSLW